jgi:hypothetical protein
MLAQCFFPFFLYYLSNIKGLKVAVIDRIEIMGLPQTKD